MENKKINWYPGHMLKAKKEIQEKLKSVDAVIEVVDARVPFSSHNKMLEETTKGKPKLILFTKIDLVEKNEFQKFEDYYNKHGYQTIKSNVLNNSFCDKVILSIEQICIKIREKYQNKGINRSLRILIIGMPNVGKSSLINLLAKKKKTVVGNRPGVTKQQQLIKISEEIELLDTPGILIPKIKRVETGYNLVLNSLIKDEVVELEDIGYYLIKNLINSKYLPKILERYKNLSRETIESFKEEPSDPLFVEKLYQEIGQSIGAISKQKDPEYQKITARIINDYRQQKFGKIILDKINDY